MNEGSPEIKARVRRIQREMSRRRMLQAVKNATVVVTNPTHFAVALEYRRAGDGRAHASSPRARTSWPRASARSRASTACRWSRTSRSRARSTRTPRSATRFLAALFGAVAEVLAYLVRIKQLVL